MTKLNSFDLLVANLIEGPFTLSFNICVFENNRDNGNRMQMQRMDSIPILCINANFTIDTILKFDTDANVNIDVQCERTFIGCLAESTYCVDWRTCSLKFSTKYAIPIN